MIGQTPGEMKILTNLQIAGQNTGDADTKGQFISHNPNTGFRNHFRAEILRFQPFRQGAAIFFLVEGLK